MIKLKNLNLVVSFACLIAGSNLSHAATWLVEAEAVGVNPSREKQLPGVKPTPETWLLDKNPEASGGMVLGGSGGNETVGIPIKIPHAGKYRVWVQHYQTPDAPTSFAVIFRSDLEDIAAYQTIDFKPIILTPEGVAPPAAAPTPRP
ncbi:MAG: hypothetical protein ABIP97_08865, partial [Chthoniobacterales bacterium]